MKIDKCATIHCETGAHVLPASASTQHSLIGSLWRQIGPDISQYHDALIIKADYESVREFTARGIITAKLCTRSKGG